MGRAVRKDCEPLEVPRGAGPRRRPEIASVVKIKAGTRYLEEMKAADFGDDDTGLNSWLSM